MSHSSADTLRLVTLFSDGACKGNPGPGGWGFILRDDASAKEMEGSGGAGKTTNNRMELRAVIHGLEALKSPCKVRIVSDSQYVLKGLSEWLPGWKRKGWKTASKAPVKNADLWKMLDALAQTHKLDFHWVRGHQGHPENERCDVLACAAAENAVKNHLPADLESDK